METVADFTDEAVRLSGLLDSGLTALREQARAVADAEAAYRKGKAEAWVGTATEDLLAKEREAQVDAATADLRRTRDLAEARARAALESVRSRRTQISALQSLLAAHRSEAEFARTAPEMAA